MTTPRSETVLAAFFAVVETVAAAEGANAYRTPTHAIPEDKFPALVQLDGDERELELETSVDTYELDVEIALVVLRPASGVIGTNYRALAGALIAAVYADVSLGGVAGVEDTRLIALDGPEVTAEEGATAYAGGFIRFRIIFSTAQGNPLAAP